MNKVARWALAMAGILVGFSAAFFGLPRSEELLGIKLGAFEVIGAIALVTVFCGVLGFLLAPMITRAVMSVSNWAEGRVSRAPVEDILAGAFGLIIGLIIAFLLTPSLARIPIVGPVLPTLGSLVLGYIGLSTGVKKSRELAGVVNLFPKFGKDRGGPRGEGVPKVLDTSVIIDGRIADICQSGFIEGPLVIPGFVLEELRHIADSSDVLKRNRGRRGLDILNRIQKELDIPVQIYERDPGGTPEVDSKLVRLAKQLHGRVVTNDYNLNKVAELHGVSVLNINELANAVKPVVLPGEEMVVRVIKDGKEVGQGVAYLDDGTMIVVEGGKRYIGNSVDVMVTSVLQTAAGRMIFAKPKPLEKAAP